MKDDTRLRTSESALYAAFSPLPAPAERFFDTPSLNHKLGTLLNIATSGAEIGLVKGPDGAGKSTLIRRLDALLETRPGVTFLTMEATPGIRLPQALGERLGLDADDMGNTPSKRLIEYLRHLRGGGMAVALAIDDAQHLLPDDLIFLASLSLSPNPTKGGLLHLMLFATPAIDERLKRVGHAVPPERLFDMPVPPLSAEQTADYIRHRLRQAGLGGNHFPAAARLSAIHRRSGGRPATINLLMRGEREPGGRRGPSIPLPVIAGGGVAAVAVIGLALWALGSGDTPTPEPPAVSASQPPTAPPTLPPSLPEPPVDTPPAPPQNPPPVTSTVADDGEPDTQSEPPPNLEEAIAQTLAAIRQTIPEPPPQVAPPPEATPRPEVTETTTDTPPSAVNRPSPFAAQSAPPQPAPAPISLVSTPTTSLATPSLSVKPTLTTTAATPSTATPAWLSASAGNAYLIQLLASDDRAKVERFVATHDLPGQPVILATTARGSRWHVLLLGPYANEAEAAAALGRLPPALKAGKPWLRSVSALREVAAIPDN